MASANYEIGDSFSVQFAWKLPEGDYLRAVFEAKVLDLMPQVDKYVVQLTKLVAGRQESAEGRQRSRDAYSREYWAMVGLIAGQKVTLAYEVDDGRALHMRLATLTGEHNFFRRFSDAEAFIEEQRAKASTEDPPPEIAL